MDYVLIQYIHAVIWLVVGVVMFIGDLTYAQYYTKLNEKITATFWVVYGTITGIAALNYALSAVMNNFIPVDRRESSFQYGLNWLSVMAVVAYIVLLILYSGIGFMKAKEYFRKKRNS